ncbi:putative transcription factor interactor and regulator CCHC(Zn) family [Helianthus anomalus]
MDILHQLALLSVRTSKFYKRTGRKFPGLHGNLRVGLDKSKIKCYKCNRLGHFARECRSQTAGPIITHPSSNPRPQNQSTVHYAQYTPAAQVNTAHYVVAPVPVHYVQTAAPQIKYVQAPAPQAQVQPAPQTTAPVVTQPDQQSFFTQEFVDWSSMPENLSDENFALYASNDSPHNEFCLMALESIQEGVESEEEHLNIETEDEVIEAVVTAVAGKVLLGESSGTLIEPLIDPWLEEKAGEKEGRVGDEENPQCDCAMMVAAKVSPQVLEKLCSDNCIIAFANIKEVNENLRNKILTDEVKFERSLKELKNKLTEKEKEISSMKEEQSITKTQLQTMVENTKFAKRS